MSTKKTNIIINADLNLFIFLGEISGARKSFWSDKRKKEWIKESGGNLNKEEKERLAVFTRLFGKTGYNFIKIQFLLFQNKEAWRKIEKLLGKDKGRKLYDIMHYFLSRFNIIWKNKKPILIEIKTFFKKESSGVRSGIKKINILCNTKNDKEVPIHLIFGSNQKNDLVGSFSAMNQKYDFIFEYSYSTEEKDLNFLNLVYLHEFFHISIRRNKKLHKLIERLATKNKEKLLPLDKCMNEKQILEELLISSFVPEGYLASIVTGKEIKQKLFNKQKVRQLNFTKVREYIAFKMASSAENLVSNKLKLEKNYIQEILNIIINGQQKNLLPV